MGIFSRDTAALDKRVQYEGKVTVRLTAAENETVEGAVTLAVGHLTEERPLTAADQTFGTRKSGGHFEIRRNHYGPVCVVHCTSADMMYRIALRIQESVPGITVTTYTITDPYCVAYFN